MKIAGALGFMMLIPAAAASVGVAGEPRLPLSENPYALNDEKACGPLCIGFLDRYLGGACSYEEIIERCPPGAMGVNLEQVQAALEAFGYHTRAVQLSVDSIKHLKWPCLLYEEKTGGVGHFIVVTRWLPGHETFQVYSPPESLDELPASELENRMTGLGLIVSREPLPAEAELVPAAWSWRFLLGCEIAAVGLLVLLIGRRPKSKTFAVMTSRTITTAMLLASCLASSCSHEPEPEDPFTIDVGDVLQGPPITAAFRIPNESETPFRIQTVERSCDCEDVTFDAQREVTPGGIAEIAVVVPSEAVVGPIAKEFVVHTTAEDERYARFRLVLKGHVRAMMRAVPSKVMFDATTTPETVRKLRIETDPPELVEQFRRVDAPPFVDVELSERNRSGLLFDVRLRGDAPNGALDGTIVVHFNHPQAQRIEVPVLGRKAGPVRITPARIVVNGGGGEETVKVRIASANGKRFRLLSTNTPAGVTPAWESDQPQEAHLIEVFVSAPDVVDGKVIKIMTDLPKQRVLQIPISVAGLQ